MTTYRSLIAGDDGGLVFDESGVNYLATISGINIEEQTDPTSVDHVLNLNGLGQIKKVSPDIWMPNIHAYLTGGPDQSVTASNSYHLAIPIGSVESASAFAESNAATIVIRGISICAEYYSGSIITDNTTIQISNKKKSVGGASTLSATLTHTGAETDRRVSAAGLVTLTTATDAIYVHFISVGGHGGLNVWIWFTKESLR